MEFRQPVSMAMIKEQYETDLKQPLLTLGYKESSINDWDKWKYLCTNASDTPENLINMGEWDSTNRRRYFIDHYNPKLFLAIAAMTIGDSPIIGEYMYSLTSENCRETCPIGQLRKVTGLTGLGYSINGHKYSTYGGCWRKASLEELIKHFTKTETMDTKVYTITREELQKIWFCACETWKGKIINLSKEYGSPLSNAVMIPEFEVKKMFDAAGVHNGVDQKAVLREVFPDYSTVPNTIQAMADEYCGDVVADVRKNRGSDEAMISLLQKGRGDTSASEATAFYLSTKFNWKIVNGTDLIPTPRS